jgi:hypothetical protein
MPATKTFENGVASVVFIAGISIKPRHACLGEAAVRQRILLERRTAASCHRGEPNRKTTAGRDPLRRHTHSFAAAALSCYPSTRPHLVDAAINGTMCLRPRVAHPAAKPMTGWCTGQDIRNDPSAVEADQFYAVKPRRIWPWPPLPAPSRSAAIRCGGSQTAGRYGISLVDSALKPLGVTTASAQRAP